MNTPKSTIIVDGTTYAKVPDPANTPLSIIVADRGWVFVGHMQTDEHGHKMHDARVVRRWGTTKGLAQLASDGPLTGTKLEDPCPVTVPLRSVVAIFACAEDKW